MASTRTGDDPGRSGFRNRPGARRLPRRRRIPAGQQITRSHLTVFSPLGTAPLTTAKTADTATVVPGATDGYTITIHNPNLVPVPMTSITDTLPPGFSYVTGSTTGAVTTDPAIAGQNLTWTGLPAVAAGGDLVLHFSVKVSMQPGTHTNQVTADAGTFTVAGSGAVAPVAVLAPPTPTPTPTPPATVEPIPTTSTGGIAMLAVLLALAAVVVLFRRSV